MNTQKNDILKTIFLNSFTNQRILAEESGHSLGVVNRSIRELMQDGYIDKSIRPTNKAVEEFKQKAPNARLFWLQVLECGWFLLIQKYRKDC